MTKENKRIQCDCSKCIEACESKPGWFKPGEAEKVAEYLEITMQKLFDNYLAIDWFCGNNNKDNIFVLSPATNNSGTGTMFPYNPKGTCIFLENGKCKIHEVAPFECKEYLHEQTTIEINHRHEEVAKLWVNEKEYLKELLGDEPCSTEPTSVFDMFGLFSSL